MKPSVITSLLLPALLLFTYSIQAQQFNFKNFTVRDGLGSNDINHIFQDSRGYIWFATQGGGVSRFNGKEFKTFSKYDGLPSGNEATFIAEDKTGNIWVATSHGASVFNGTKFKNYGSKDGLTDGFVYCIYVDNANRIWMATKGEGVRTFYNNKFDSITAKTGLPNDTVYTITGDSKGNYWFGLSNGIAKYDGHKISDYNYLPEVKDRTFFSSLSDNKGNIWMGSATGKVICISGSGVVTDFALPALEQNDFIGSIACDKADNIWFATDHGLLKYHDTMFSLFSEKEGLSVNSTQTVLCDYEGNTWVGTLGGGVNLLRSEAFVSYGEKDGLKSVNISCILQDSLDKNRYYAGTAGNGLYIFNQSCDPKFIKVDKIPDINNINISALALDGKGLLWISAQEGVFVLEQNGGKLRLKKKIRKINGVNLISPTCLICDTKKNWINHLVRNCANTLRSEPVNLEKKWL